MNEANEKQQIERKCTEEKESKEYNDGNYWNQSYIEPQCDMRTQNICVADIITTHISRMSVLVQALSKCVWQKAFAAYKHTIDRFHPFILPPNQTTSIPSLAMKYCMGLNWCLRALPVHYNILIACKPT